MGKKVFVIIGGLYFDKVNGNTYHRAKIIATESPFEIYYTDYGYGYDSAYMHSARRYIREELGLQEDACEIINGGFMHMGKKALKAGNF